MFFTFTEDARWNPDRQAVEFGVAIGEYQGVVRVPRQVFRRFVDSAVTPERCIEAYHLHRTRLELVAERKLRQRQLTEDGNVEITGRDLREPKRRQPTHLGCASRAPLTAAEEIGDIGLIVDHQDADAHAAAPVCGAPPRGRSIVNSVNSPGRLSTSIVPPCCCVTMS